MVNFSRQAVNTQMRQYMGKLIRKSLCFRECYYPSVRMENKALIALFSVRQGRWVDLSLDRLGFSVTCTLVALKLLT